MRTIPTTYSKHGYNFQLLSREGNAAIYQQLLGRRLVAYEAVRVRVSKDRKIEDRLVEGGEYLPSDEDWGSYGKTYGLSGSTDREAKSRAEAQMRVWLALEASVTN